MARTLEELKHFMKIINSNHSNGPIGTYIYNMGQVVKDADPVSDIRSIRSGA